MDFSEKWGTDVNTAVKLALDDLKLTIDEVDVTVLEEPSRGFFGIGSKLALVRVEKKKNLVKKEEKKPEPKKEEPKAKVEETRFEEKNPEKSQKFKSEKTDTTKNKKERAPKKTKKVQIPAEPVIERVPDAELTEIPSDHVAIKFLEEVTQNMGLDLQIKGKEGRDVLYIDIQGKESGTIIGKRGQTLDAIQYLTSLVVTKENSGYTRVVVDAENYRTKREKTLELLAIRLAKKVVKTKRNVKLEPMNPYERKVIHATLQSNPHVTTRSEGQDPYRRVIIELK